MEYLTTYGWAILIIAIVIAALFMLVSSAPTQVQECILPAGFSCPAFYMSSDGVLFINLVQATQYPIQVSSIGCTNPESLSYMVPVNQLTYAPTNVVDMPIGSNQIFNVPCYSNGTAFSGTPSSIFSGYLIINYTNAYTNFPNTVYGSVRVAVSK